MAYEQRDDSGALFKNDKEGNENRPDYTGNCMVNGKEMRIAAWIKEASTGIKFMSLNFSEPQEKSNSAPDADPNDDLDDEVPFS